MNKKQAQEILGKNRSKWELRNMKKALSSIPFLNTDNDNKRLKATKTLLQAIRDDDITAKANLMLKASQGKRIRII